MAKSRIKDVVSSESDRFFQALEPRVLLTGGQTTEVITWHGVSLETVRGSWIVTFDNLLGRDAAVTRADQVIAALGVQATSVAAIGRGGYAQFTTTGHFSENDVARVLGQMPGVVQVEPNRIEYTDAVPNDPLLATQWAHLNTGQFIPGLGNGVSGADIHSTRAWDTTIGSQSVIIADIDTGLDLTHPDLAANIWHNPGEIPGNGIDDDGNGFIDDVSGWDFDGGDNSVADWQGHGTATAGCIGAVGNNGIGISGVNWTVSLLPVKVFPDFGGGAAEANIVAAHDYLTDLITRYHYNIVASNNSYGAFLPTFFNQFVSAEEMAIQRFVATGATFVAAAGNNSNNNDAAFTSFPASYPIPELISVAATDNRDGLAGFSNYGLMTVDLGAPGVNTLTTAPGGGYVYISGTSFSSPYTAGAVGLLKAHKPNASQTEIKRALLDGADRIPSLENRTVSGGRLNVAESLRIIDIEGPVVTAISPGPVTAPVNLITVAFSKRLDPSLINASFIDLRRANGDQMFNSNDILVPIANSDVSLDASGMILTIDLSHAGEFPFGFPVDLFQLTLDAHGFRDLNGNYLNGNTNLPGPAMNQVYVFDVQTFSGVFEPNDTLATAAPAIFDATGRAVFAGATVGDGVNFSLDVDIYRFMLAGPGLITAVVDARDLPIPSQLDSYLRLFGANGLQLAANDNFDGLDSRIEFFVPTGGIYYVGVSGFGNANYQPNIAASGSAQSTGDYNLTITVNLIPEDSTSYNSTHPPIAIPSFGTITDTITITDTRNIVDANVRVRIDHPFDSDLQIRLISPQGTSVALVLNRGGSGDNFGQNSGPGTVYTIFDDETSTGIAVGSPPFAGSFRPETPLSALDGQSAGGTWTLQITDTKPLDAGTLLAWGIDLTVANNIFGPFELNDTIILAKDTGINGTGTQSLTAHIGDGAFGLRDVDLFRFVGAAGTTLNATVTPGAGTLDSVLRLFDSQGNELLIDDRTDTTESSVSFTITQGSTFYLGVSGAGNNNYVLTSGGSGNPSATTGDYTIQISVVGGISNGTVIVHGSNVGLGVNADGSIGVNSGLNGVGVSLNNIDFLVTPDPAHAVESFFGGTFGGFIFRNAGPGSESDLPVTMTNESDFANRRVVATGLFRGLEVRRSFSFGVNDQFIAVDVTLRNTTTNNMGDVAWMEAFNPDQGLNRQTTFTRTINNVQNATGRLVTAAYFDNDFRGGLTIGLGSANNSGFTVATSVEDRGSLRDPFQILGSVNDPDPAGDTGVSADKLISIAYNVGALQAGGVATMRYFIFMGTSVAAVNAQFAILDNGTGTGHLVPDPNGPAIASANLPYAAYYPEGYANSRASTFIPIINPNESGARVVVIARYEVGDRDQVLYDSATDDLDGNGVADGVIAAHSRSGLTLTTPALYSQGDAVNVFSPIAGRQGVRKDTPYAVEIRSSLPIGANLSHFDFGVSTGKAFTTTTSTLWTIAEGFKGTGVFDFLVYYNTSNQRIKVTTTIYPEGNSAPVELIQFIDPLRRGGWALNSLAQVPDGPYGIRVDAEGPIVAALTHYDTNFGGGDGILGLPDTGSLKGATPEGQVGINSAAEFVTILNLNSAQADITFTFFFANGSAYRQLVSAAALHRSGFNVATLPSFPTGQQAYSIAYESSLPVTVNITTFAFGEAASSNFAEVASSLWLFADGFRPLPGNSTVHEYLRLYNPTVTDLNVEITITFNDGGSEKFRETVSPRAANEFNIHDFVTGARATMGTVPGIGSFYGLRVEAPEPIVAYMGHFDSFFFGGFGTLGMPMGNTEQVI